LANIYAGKTSHSDLINMFNDPNRTMSREQLKDYSIAIQKTQEQNQHGGIFRNPEFHESLGRIKTAITGSTLTNFDPELGLKLDKGSAYFSQSMLNYVGQPVPPSADDINKKMIDLEQETIRKYGGRDTTKNFKYDPAKLFDTPQATSSTPANLNQPSDDPTEAPTSHEPGQE
jgi:hypothetical protein